MIAAGQTALFQSTPLMRGETDAKAEATEVTKVSIHSPHARGDLLTL